MLNHSPTKEDTVYTVMRNLQDITNNLGQKTTVLIFDQAIYFKAKEIQWDKKDEFNDFVLRLGGFHMLTSYMAAVGKLMNSGGYDRDIERKWIVWGCCYYPNHCCQTLQPDSTGPQTDV